jgi:hypothetical protein
VQEIGDWLKTLGMSEYAERFAESDIDTSVLCELTDCSRKRIVREWAMASKKPWMSASSTQFTCFR